MDMTFPVIFSLPDKAVDAFTKKHGITREDLLWAIEDAIVGDGLLWEVARDKLDVFKHAVDWATVPTDDDEIPLSELAGKLTT